MNRRVAIVFTIASLLVSAASCEDEDPPFGDSIKVGVMSDLPGLGQLVSGKYRGFDIELADWLGNELKTKITKIHINVEDREEWLENGQVDLVIAAYSITDARAKQVDFVGPYMYDRQGVLTRADGPTITGQEHIRDKFMCTLSGSTSEEQLRLWQAIVTPETVIKDCIDGLLYKRTYQAVSTDRIILAGYAKQHKDDLHLADFTFGKQERYGIGIKKNSFMRCRLLTEKLDQFIRSGKWGDFFRNNFPELDPNQHKPVPNDIRQCKHPSVAP